MAPDIEGEVKWVVWGEFAQRLWGVQIQAKNRDGGGGVNRTHPETQLGYTAV